MKFKKVLLIILSCVMLSGCWDKIEIDRNNFISTIAVDPGKDIDKEEEMKSINPEEPFAERQIKKINVTYGFPDMSKIEAGKSGGVPEKYISTEAYSMEDAASEAMAKSSRSIYMGHSKLLILSSDLLEHKDTFKEVLDYLDRNPNLNRTMQVVVSDGKAEDYVKFKPMTENSTQYYISGLMENSERNSRIMNIDLNEVLILLSENGNALVPRISIDKEKEELILTGAAIIKDYKLKGYFNPLELMDVQLLSDKFSIGKRVIYMDGHPVDYVIDGYQRKIRVEEAGDKLSINIDLEVEGQLAEYYTGKKVLEKGELQKLQDTFNKSISEECEKIIKIAKEEFEIDPFGVREHIEKFKPSLWNKIEKNWDEKYKSASVNVIVSSKIRRIGAVK
jgi:spore germination protein